MTTSNRASYGIMGDAAGTNGYNFVAGYDYPATGSNVQGLPQVLFLMGTILMRLV